MASAPGSSSLGSSCWPGRVWRRGGTGSLSASRRRRGHRKQQLLRRQQRRGRMSENRSRIRNRVKGLCFLRSKLLTNLTVKITSDLSGPKLQEYLRPLEYSALLTDTQSLRVKMRVIVTQTGDKVAISSSTLLK